MNTAPVTICIADTPELLNKIYGLRFSVYTQEVPSFKPEDFPDGLEKDQYDAYSIHIAAIVNDKVVGTLRLVKDSPIGFVMESAFALPSQIQRDLAVEHSRGIVVKEFRDKGLYLQMLDFAYEWQRKNNKPISLGAPNMTKLAHMLKNCGWTEIGNPTEYHGITVVPMMHTLD
jgi:N-acyl amino acid synthase of PEP-CTERM/exosortase system